MNKLMNRLHDEEKGFTLIELMVVVLIIAILIAIAIPTFLGARRRAQDRAAQASLRNTVTGAKAIFTDRETYSDATASALRSGEPALTFDDAAASSGQNVVSVEPDSALTQSVFYAAVLSKSGTCWYVRDAVDPNAVAGTTWAQDETDPDCTAAYARTQEASFTAATREPSDAAAI